MHDDSFKSIQASMGLPDNRGPENRGTALVIIGFDLIIEYYFTNSFDSYFTHANVFFYDLNTQVKTVSYLLKSRL